jgi:DNA-binding PadR family transcriptional regulator
MAGLNGTQSMSIDDADRTLEDVLEAVEDFGTASFGLIAWELLSREESIAPIWRQAVEQRMLRATGTTDLDEPTYQLTPAGRTRLRDLRQRSARGREPDRSPGIGDP